MAHFPDFEGPWGGVPGEGSLGRGPWGGDPRKIYSPGNTAFLPDFDMRFNQTKRFLKKTLIIGPPRGFSQKSGVFWTQNRLPVQKNKSPRRGVTQNS